MHTTSNMSKKPHIDLSKVSNKWIKKNIGSNFWRNERKTRDTQEIWLSCAYSPNAKPTVEKIFMRFF